MGTFETKRADAIRRKNEAYVKAEGFEKQSENLEKTKKEVADAKSRIPSDLPEAIKSQIDSVFEKRENELQDASDKMADDIKEAMDDANEAIDDMRDLGNTLEKKGSKLLGLKDVPLVGSFLENKGKQLDDQSEQMYDLAKEAQKYSDKLAESRNRAMRRP